MMFSHTNQLCWNVTHIGCFPKNAVLPRFFVQCQFGHIGNLDSSKLTMVERKKVRLIDEYQAIVKEVIKNWTISESTKIWQSKLKDYWHCPYGKIMALPQTDTICNLEVLQDWTRQPMARRAFAHLQVVHLLHPYLDWEVLLTVTHALVTYRLDYNNTLYTGLPLKTIWKLQLVQNMAGKY